MPSVAESSGAPGQLAAGLAEGLQVISSSQQIEFIQYTQLVLPIDGYIYWVNTGTVVTAAGSLHQSIDQRQEEDQTIDVNRIIFTSTVQIDAFNNISPTTILIGTFGDVRFAFSRRDAFYQQAGLYHYLGDAIYPAMESQIVDNPADLNSAELVVSNSLPVWLTLNQYMPMYPSFLVPANAAPPYASVHIDANSTEAIGSAPAFDYEMTHTQLAKERVKITMYGMTNQQALDFQDYVNQYSLNTDVIGVMNIPIIRDEKRTQAELAVIAMKKSFDIEISYYQTRVNDVARQFIESALVQFIVSSSPY